jgi:hypothetical protein
MKSKDQVLLEESYLKVFNKQKKIITEENDAPDSFQVIKLKKLTGEILKLDIDSVDARAFTILPNYRVLVTSMVGGGIHGSIVDDTIYEWQNRNKIANRTTDFVSTGGGIRFFKEKGKDGPKIDGRIWLKSKIGSIWPNPHGLHTSEKNLLNLVAKNVYKIDLNEIKWINPSLTENFDDLHNNVILEKDLLDTESFFASYNQEKTKEELEKIQRKKDLHTKFAGLPKAWRDALNQTTI